MAPMSIHEAMFVPVNGVAHWITIRGEGVRNPVILMLHGSPGFPTSELAPVFAQFEKDYTLVQWDQPGGGATYAKNIGKDIGPLTISRYCRTASSEPSSSIVICTSAKSSFRVRPGAPFSV